MRVVVMAIVTFAILASCLYAVIALGVARVRKMQAMESAGWQKPRETATTRSSNEPPAPATEPAAEIEPLPEPATARFMIFLLPADAKLDGPNALLVDEHGVTTRDGKPISLDAHTAKLLPKAPASGRTIQPYLARFYKTQDAAEWNFVISDPGKYAVNIVYSCRSWTFAERGQFYVTVAGRELTSPVDTGPKKAKAVHMDEVGIVDFPAGPATLRLSLESQSAKPPAIAVRSVRLYKAE